jgi:hypothetical protein
MVGQFSFSSRYLKINNILFLGPDMCHEAKPYFKTYFDIIEKFLIRMNEFEENRSIPYFSFNFLTEYTRKRVSNLISLV